MALTHTDILLILVLAAVAAVAFLLLRKGGDAGSGAARTLEMLGAVAAKVDGVAVSQDQVRAQVGQHQQQLASMGAQVQATLDQQQALRGAVAASETALAQRLAETREVLGTELARATQLVGEMKAAEAAVRSQQDAVAASIKRLEDLLAGSKSRGQAGENIVGAILAQLPAGWVDTNVRVNNKTVEFALRLPGQKWIPIDSKWPALPLLDQWARTDDPAVRKGLEEKIRRETGKKAEEVAKYLDPDQTLDLAVAVVPDAVYDLCLEERVSALRSHVVLVSYSQALPFLLSLLYIGGHYASRSALDPARVMQALQRLSKVLEDIDREGVKGLDGVVVRLQNITEKLKMSLGSARQDLARLDAPGDGAPAEPAPPALPEIAADAPR